MKASSAHSKVAEAIRKGQLTKLPCESCGKEKASAHHDDYDKPLDVRWLCRSCHMRHHAENGPGLNMEDDGQIKMRAFVSLNDWKRFRIKALAEGKSSSDLLGELIRADIQGKGTE